MLSRLSSGRVAIAKHLDTLMLASLAMLGITLRASSPASLSVLSIVSSLAVLNTAFLLPNDSGEWRVVGVSAASFLTLTLIHITLQGAEPLHTLLIHVTFFAMLLALMAIEYPAISNTLLLVYVFTPAIPVTVVLSMILASYVGSRIGVALVMLGLIDLSVSLAVVSRWRGAKALTLSILVFILLHTHVALGLGFRQILILLIISVLRVLMLISRKAIFVKILTLADIAVRSVVA